MLYDDAPAFCDDGDDGCNCNDDDSHDDNVCNAYDHDNNHAHGALAVSADGVHHDAE